MEWKQYLKVNISTKIRKIMYLSAKNKCTKPFSRYEFISYLWIQDNEIDIEFIQKI